MNNSIFYPAPFFFLRSSRWTIEDFYRIISEKNWIDAIFQLYETDELLKEAIEIASPSLHQTLQKASHKNREATATSLLNYALRMATRAIPFGLFSFVAVGYWGKNADIYLNLNNVQKRARPDMAWVYELIRNIFTNESLFSSLAVYTNPLAKRHEHRFILDYVRLAEEEEKQLSKKTSISASELVKTILSHAKHSKSIGELADQVLVSLPGLDRLKVIEVIRELIQQQFLLPSLIPSLLSFSPFEDFLKNVPSKAQFQNIVEKLLSYNMSSPGKGVLQLQSLQSEMKEIAQAKTYLQVDSFLQNPSLQLPSKIGEELAAAATVLWKLTHKKHPSTHLSEYHKKFIEKYGTHRTVPLLELLSEERGLGNFENGKNTSHKVSSSFAKEWDKWLHRQLLAAIWEKKDEIIVTDEVISNLYALTKEPSPSPEEALPSLDLFCKIISDSKEMIDSNNYLIQIIQPTCQGGNSIGRFIDLLDEKAHHHFKALLEMEEELDKNSVHLEISYWPMKGHQANVSTHPCFRKFRLDLSCSNPEVSSLSLEDIYVGASLDRFYLTLKEGGCELAAKMCNLLNPAVLPIPLKFMREVTLQKYGIISSFFWNQLEEKTSFLPRIRFQNTILAPAQWNLDSNSFYRIKKEDLISQFTNWANQWKLPQYCFLVKGDQHLLIDRTHSAHLNDLILKLSKGESLKFVENMDSSWIKSERGSHMCEFVVPLLKQSQFSNIKKFIPAKFQSVSIDERIKLPGSEWIFIKIYLEEEQNRFLVHHLFPLADQLCREKKGAGWFFLRYRDPNPHIRFRMRLTNPQNFSSVIFSFQRQAMDWIKTGLIKDFQMPVYEREIERYGGLERIEAAEVLFCSDSLSMVPLLSQVLKQSSSSEMAFYTLSAIEFLQGFNLNREAMLQLLDPGDNKSDLKGYRDHKNELLSYARTLLGSDPGNKPKYFIDALRLRKGGQNYFVSNLQNLSQEALHDIYHSMLHMHCNRLGCDVLTERKIRLYAHQTLNMLEKQKVNL